jgi:hypothetical protein
LAWPKEGTPDYRKGKDKESVQKILEEIKAKQAPTDMRRLGAPPKQNNEGQENEREKCRPLRLTFQSETERDEVLKAFRIAVRNAEDGNITKKVALRKDMTPTEREEERRLFLELKRKKDQSKQEGDNLAVWIRRRGEVINVGKYPQRQALEGEGEREGD